ncbi:MAG TPA: hypothetical protein VF776_09335, partial [Sphingomicrobium sp.]
ALPVAVTRARRVSLPWQYAMPAKVNEVEGTAAVTNRLIPAFGKRCLLLRLPQRDWNSPLQRRFA